MIRLLALWAVLVAAVILLVILREERLASERKVPLGRLRRLWLRGDRRRFPRYRIDWPVKYQRLQENTLIQAKTRDLSQAGIGMIVREMLEKGSRIKVELNPPGESAPLSLAGEVVWVREVPKKADASSERLFFLGVQFLSMDSQNLQRILKSLGKTP